MCREAGQQTRSLKLPEVSRVRLAYEPTRAQLGLWTCRVFNREGVHWATLSSSHYRALLDFEDRGVSYGAFVRGLNDAVIGANPQAVFDTGPGMMAFVFNGVALVLALLLFGAMLIVVGFDEVSGWAWFRLLLLLPFVALCWPWFARNWPRRFDPKAVPAGLLPEG